MEVQNYDKITDKLLPCPFCGGTPVWYRKGNDYTKSQTIIVKCPKCRIERKDAILNNHRHTIEWLEEVAIKNWNQRAFIAGAQWQKERDQSTIELAEDHAYLAGQEKIIEKACEWLNNFYSEDRHCYFVEEDIDDFKKYMEG